MISFTWQLNSRMQNMLNKSYYAPVHMSLCLPGYRCSSSSCTCRTAAGRWWCHQFWPSGAPWWPPGWERSSAVSARHLPFPMWRSQMSVRWKKGFGARERFWWASGLDLGRHGGNAAQLNVPSQDISAKPRVLGVLQVANPTADSVLILHISGLYLLVDMCTFLVKEELNLLCLLCLIRVTMPDRINSVWSITDIWTSLTSHRRKWFTYFKGYDLQSLLPCYHSSQ